MTGWTALVPLKLNAESKSRLAAVLTSAERIALIAGMAGHVLDVLGQIEQVRRIVVLSAERPEWWKGAWAEDRAHSLNAALEVWRSTDRAPQLLVVHGDLPLVQPNELVALLRAAEDVGAAIATDRRGLGTNALALSSLREFAFRFGSNSRHHHAAQQPCAVLELPGLASDVDEPGDLAELGVIRHLREQT